MGHGQGDKLRPSPIDQGGSAGRAASNACRHSKHYPPPPSAATMRRFHTERCCCGDSRTSRCLATYPFPAPRHSTTPAPQHQQSCNPHQTACLCLLGQASVLGEGQAWASGWGWTRALTRGNASSEGLGAVGRAVVSLSIVGTQRISSQRG